MTGMRRPWAGNDERTAEFAGLNPAGFSVAAGALWFQVGPETSAALSRAGCRPARPSISAAEVKIFLADHGGAQTSPGLPELQG
jgi:hypothetical protein